MAAHHLAPRDDRDTASAVALVALAPPLAIPAADATGAAILRAGCYRLALRPDRGIATFHGTVRVTHDDAGTTVTGDLYAFPRLAGQTVGPPDEHPPPAMSALGRPLPPLRPPAHPRERYRSHLRATAVRAPHSAHHPIATHLELAFDEHRYARCRFAAARSLALALERRPHPPGYTALYLEGALVEDGVPTGRVALGWVARAPVHHVADLLAPRR
jgi:hypothetical protein